jgi:hypothetical protein
LGRAKGKRLSNPNILDNLENDACFQEKIKIYNLSESFDREQESQKFTQKFQVWSVQPGIDVAKTRFTGTEIDLCVICARALVSAGKSMTSIACVFCQLWDCLLGYAIGESEFLGLTRTALGLHEYPPAQFSPLAQQAQIDGIGSIINSWLNLYYWQANEISILIQDAGWEHQELITLSDWTDEYPENALTSLEAYIRLIEDQHPWAIYLCPESMNLSWYYDQLPQSKERVE